MKKLLLLFALSFVMTQANAEVWFDIGAKAAYAPGVFTNGQILASNQLLNYSHGYFVGGKIGVNFGLTHSMTIDVVSSKTNQKLTDPTKTNSHSLSLSSIDIPIMYRNNQSSGGYSEIGPQITITQSAETKINGVSTDVKSSFNSSNMGVAFGFGQYIGGSDSFGFNMGVRFAYMFGDIVASSSQDLQGDPVFQPVSPAEFTAYRYKPSGRLYAGVVLEANFNIGYITQGSRCAKRTRFKMF
ncbi:MAG: hypothetical protein ACJAZ2_001129 [Glaciecola sp.]|jgi:hypothetical protein